MRPHVWKLARAHGIRGEVRNDAEGVNIHAWGDNGSLDAFIHALSSKPPPLARIEDILYTPLPDAGGMPRSFTIVDSRAGQIATEVAADAATCLDCLAEVMNPADRRYRYPFTNCTHCGPRLSIVNAIPYDRANTSMAAFRMCKTCRAEYENPADRRFHAQPNACPECGPRLCLQDGEGRALANDEARDAIETAARLIREGYIVAIKGIGGIHLACDAGNEQAVASLRRRKQRYHKAFALMARDLNMVRRFARLDDAEAELLQERAAPIVILDARGEMLAPGIASGIAPGQNTLAFMLPHTPLHHLLMLNMETPVVLTSGNRSEEPQAIDNDDARKRLRGIADYYLLHDRDIVNRLDDSVLRVAAGKPRMIRRARGYAPRSMQIPEGFDNETAILAMGADLKNTFCLLQDGRAVLSQHIGDIADAATHEDCRRMLRLYRELFDSQESIIAVDKHPNYHSSELGRAIAAQEGLRLLEVQHHHAHIAACMCEHGLPLDTPKVLGIALDGLGYGDDGTLWGGEFLLAGYRGYRRLAHFAPVAMIGGTQAIRQPWRNTFAHLLTCMQWDRVAEQYAALELMCFLKSKPLRTMRAMAEKGLNSPPSSSAGRLFDAVAAALGVCRESAGYEGQAAVELEALAGRAFEAQAGYGYEYEAGRECLDWAPMWTALLNDLAAGESPVVIAARFHHGLAGVVAGTASRLCGEHDIDTIVLAGGVFQNRLLLEGVESRLHERGLRVLAPQVVPANDGGLALGQAAIACGVLGR